LNLSREKLVFTKFAFSNATCSAYTAARRAHLPMVQRLIECGADPTLRSDAGQAPADVAGACTRAECSCPIA
jgi:hypothetical protein